MSLVVSNASEEDNWRDMASRNRMRAEKAEAEVTRLRAAFNAMVMFSFDGEPCYRTTNDIGQVMPPVVSAAVLRLLREAPDDE